jgi:hypothetical protein
MKTIDIKEFREKGYLQELNRRFLHPLGLALGVNIDEDGNETLGNIWDYRNDPEGIYYDLINSDQNRIDKFLKNEKFISDEFEKRKDCRIKLLDDLIEPILREVKNEK